MSEQLIRAGYPLTVYNRSKEKEAFLQGMGAATAPTPRQLMETTEIIFIMVSDDAAIREIFHGKGGLLTADAEASTEQPTAAIPSPKGPHTVPPGRILINMSTVSPAISREMAATCRQQGHHYLDAPVSGSVKQAEDGQLVIMVGGEASVLEKARPVLEKIGRLAIRVGDPGAGNTAKLVINTLLSVYAQGLAEAVIFAQRNGITTEDLITLVNNSALGNVFIKIKGEAIIRDNYNAAFALKHIAKDLRLAKDIGLNTPLGEVAYQSFQDAEATLGNEDIIAIIKQLQPQ